MELLSTDFNGGDGGVEWSGVEWGRVEGREGKGREGKGIRFLV